ncbi:MAG TPA: hypothetical protein VMJ34_05945 [Bryobacteraceae bacterium]|nr:hypothetical protein [Bryobacteraceae bacterium]
MGRKLIISLLLLAFAAFAADDVKPNFSGTWKLNAEKSDFGPMPGPDSRTDTIDHKEPVVKESVAMSSSQGDMNWDLTYTTDGKESKNTVMGSEMTSTAKWDGNTLVVDSKANFGGSDMTIHGTMVLSDDGKTLTRQAHFSGPMGEGDQKLVFDKQ